jgi:alanyl-tRNA synthetase
MKRLTGKELREAFLGFFAERGHAIVPSSSLVPHNDPTLLFANAGMVQFKDVFLGLEKREYTRAATSQKCMRVSGKHNDLETVGPSPRHHTFFEMLGNFSFGDYFKKDAIRFAWDFLAGVLELDPSRLWPTVYEEDDEAFDLWRDMIGVSTEKIARMGKKTNFWMMGDTGPCGPNSEVHYDRGAEFCTCGDPNCSPAIDNGCDRWWELWNLVFMQFNMDAAGNMTRLPNPGVDTGMGFERVVSLLQDAPSNYDTDLFVPIMRRIQELLGHSDEEARERYVGYRIIADHGRATTFLVGDGVRPGNEGRGYVLRLILRRAARHGKMLGFEGPFLDKIARVVIDEMGDPYTELKQRREFILKVIQQEEERFQQTLSTGLGLLEEIVAALTAQGKKEIPGEDAFKLYDTYGFPLDLTREVAAEQGFAVDVAGFQAALAEQRERARAAQRFGPAGDDEQTARHRQIMDRLQAEGKLPHHGVAQLFYEAYEADTTLVGILRGGALVDSAAEGDEAGVIVAETPFYTEKGGQVGDTGIIAGHVRDTDELSWEFEVSEVKELVPGFIVHFGKMTSKSARVGDPVWAAVDYERRQDIARNHTATHILHSELRYILGEHVQQAGSLVAPDHLRFDFTHSAMLTQDELDAVEQSVNDAILANYPVAARVESYKQAVTEGAIALFGEKYGDQVRVVRIGADDEAFSQELCGGTHVAYTGEIGLFLVQSEGSIGAGVRRVVALTGRGAQKTASERMHTLNAAAAFLGCAPEEVDRKVLSLMERVQATEKQLEEWNRAQARQQFARLIHQADRVEGIPVLGAVVTAGDADTMREMTDWFREANPSGVVLLGAVLGGKPSLVAAVTEDLVKRGLNASTLVRDAARLIEGGGGGKPTLAQAGGRDASRLTEAVQSAAAWVREHLK